MLLCSEEQNIFEIGIICIYFIFFIIKFFTVPFDDFYVSLLNKIFRFFKEKKILSQNNQMVISNIIRKYLTNI